VTDYWALKYAAMTSDLDAASSTLKPIDDTGGAIVKTETAVTQETADAMRHATIEGVEREYRAALTYGDPDDDTHKADFNVAFWVPHVDTRAPEPYRDARGYQHYAATLPAKPTQMVVASGTDLCRVHGCTPEQLIEKLKAGEVAWRPGATGAARRYWERLRPRLAKLKLDRWLFATWVN
jgi:hypothetical protein